MLNIDAKTSLQHWCHLSAEGEVLGSGSIQFPIRSCYPQVALRDHAAHVMAITDIVEPIQEWKAFKREQTGREWDYVFRILYYTWTPDLTDQPFAEPLEIANVEKTGGHIGNQDLWVDPGGRAYVLYTEREVQSALLRDRFLPGRSVLNSLNLAIAQSGKVVDRHTLIEGTEDRSPHHARFHSTPDGRLFAVVFTAGKEARNEVMQIYPEIQAEDTVTIPLQNPFTSFCVASVRAGNAPSSTLDLFGHCKGSGTLSYAQVLIR
jgi:hypothetical protein